MGTCLLVDCGFEIEKEEEKEELERILLEVKYLFFEFHFLIESKETSKIILEKSREIINEKRGAES